MANFTVQIYLVGDICDVIFIYKSNRILSQSLWAKFILLVLFVIFLNVIYHTSSNFVSRKMFNISKYVLAPFFLLQMPSGTSSTVLATTSASAWAIKPRTMAPAAFTRPRWSPPTRLNTFSKNNHNNPSSTTTKDGREGEDSDELLEKLY